jgi:hypothetical protein
MINVEIKDIAMSGKLVMATLQIPEYEYQQISAISPIRDKIRHDLAMQIANTLLDNKLIETTSIMDTHSGDRIIRARCYVAPDSDVQVLRIAMKGKL